MLGATRPRRSLWHPVGSGRAGNPEIADASALGNLWIALLVDLPDGRLTVACRFLESELK